MPFFVECDASKVAVSATLNQGGRPVAFMSRVFQGNELLPGSTIIVPKQARPLSGLTFVEVITPILANLSITAASIAAIND